MNVSDADLLQRWTARGDAGAFQELVVRYSGMVYGVSRRILGNATDAEDVTQECFETVAGLRREPTRTLVLGYTELP